MVLYYLKLTRWLSVSMAACPFRRAVMKQLSKMNSTDVKINRKSFIDTKLLLPDKCPLPEQQTNRRVHLATGTYPYT